MPAGRRGGVHEVRFMILEGQPTGYEDNAVAGQTATLV